MKNTDQLSEFLGPMYASIAADGALVLETLGLPQDADILDVGTGSGKFAIFLATQGFQVLTGEPATDDTHYAGKDWASNAERAGVRDRIKFEAFSADTMSFEDERFDAVFFFGVLHHIAEGARTAVMREALRVTKPGGAVVFFEPNDATLQKIWATDPGHPLAANPADYMTGLEAEEQMMHGGMMDVFQYRKAGTGQ